MEDLIKETLDKSLPYLEYRKTISGLLSEGKSTGAVQSEKLLHYSNLNEARMDRLEKTIAITLENAAKLKLLKKKYIWLVLSESWCGDAAQLLPVMHKMQALSENIDLRIAFRDENEALMNHFLTNGGKSIPKLIIIDAASLKVMADWGPRPKEALDLVRNYKEAHGAIDESIKIELQMWYLRDKGLSTQKELLELMGTIEAQEQA
ncbi:MAG TPA: thioredoxin family protein [Flavobacterium sp.]|nr:thioredoxin family protein [Flavobacterium sp.]